MEVLEEEVDSLSKGSALYRGGSGSSPNVPLSVRTSKIKVGNKTKNT